MSPTPPIRVREVFGLDPLLPALRGCMLAIRGDRRMPPSRWGVSSLKIFKPAISLPTWLGKRRGDRRVPIYNLVNRDPAPRDQGYSVKITHARDFRGETLTYDGHIGTDFAVPVGTRVVAAAPGRVCRVSNEMQRGGLKVAIDHGGGLITSSNHLSRALVEVGDDVERGQVIGLSGMSGVDGLLFFPWLAPHVHYTVLLDGEAADPFAAGDETPLWKGGNDPCPDRGARDEALPPSEFSEAAVAAGIEACSDPDLRARLSAIGDLWTRGVELIFARMFFFPLFSSFEPIYARSHERSPRLDLPFSSEDFDGVTFPR